LDAVVGESPEEFDDGAGGRDGDLSAFEDDELMDPLLQSLGYSIDHDFLRRPWIDIRAAMFLGVNLNA
jgi:hypothetical protein